MVCLTASANLRERDALIEAGAVACLSKDEGLDAIVAAIRDAATRGGLMELTAENTAIVARLDGRLPRGAAALRQLARRSALRALRRRELQRLRRARPRRVLRAAARGCRDALDLAADAGRLPGRLRGARRLRADLLAPHPGKLSGTIESARAAAKQLGDDRVRTIDSETASAAIAMLGLAIQRRLERGTSDEEVEKLVERYGDARSCSSPSTRSSTSPAEAGSAGRGPGRASC